MESNRFTLAPYESSTIRRSLTNCNQVGLPMTSRRTSQQLCELIPESVQRRAIDPREAQPSVGSNRELNGTSSLMRSSTSASPM